MANATWQLIVTIEGPNGVDEQINNTQTLLSPLGIVDNLPLASGDNTFAIPTGASCYYFTPPPANLVPLIFKAHSGDTGQSIAPGAPFGPVYVTASTASFIINAAEPVLGLCTVKID